MARYVCPKHEDEVLFDDSAPVLDIPKPRDAAKITPPQIAFVDRPEECPKCEKSYYRWECKSAQ